MEQMEQNEAIQIEDGEIPNIMQYNAFQSHFIHLREKKKRTKSVTFSFVLRGHFGALIR